MSESCESCGEHAVDCECQYNLLTSSEEDSYQLLSTIKSILDGRDDSCAPISICGLDDVCECALERLQASIGRRIIRKHFGIKS